MNFRLKRDDSGTLVKITDASLKDVATTTLGMISLIYSQLKQNSPDVADQYMRLVVDGIFRGSQSVWEALPKNVVFVAMEIIQIDKDGLTKQMEEE